MRKPLLFSIKTKFVLVAVVIVAFFAIGWGSHVIKEERAHLMVNYERAGKVLMTTLKAPIINAIIVGEMGIMPGLLDTFVEEIVRTADLPVAYAFITDDGGKVLSHNRVEMFGRIYRDPLTSASLQEQAYRSMIVRDGSGEILDMAMPLRIAGKSWGALRVGVSTAPMEKDYSQFQAKIATFSILFFLTGTVIMYLVGYTMSRPLEKLAEAMSAIDLSALEVAPLPRRRDEIGLLQDSFNAMLVRLRRSEQERQQALNYVIQHEKIATIGKIVSGVAHEVNNPLAAISACVYNLQGVVPPEALQSLDIVQGGIHRIETIVRQLSDFSRVGSVELEYVASDAFFREAEAFAVMAMKHHDVQLVASDECHPVLLHMDKGKMHQVVLNLLMNAAYASPQGSSIVLCAARSEGSYVLSVLDHGPGIPDHAQHHIFEIFYTTKPAGVGSGIGLAVCKSIVDMHRGSIDFTSRPGETIFTVSIPLEDGGGR